MIVFQSNPGKVTRLRDPAVQCLARTINFTNNDPARIRYELQRSILTRVTLAAQTNVQFLHTLGSVVYVYVFGDRIGQLTLSGLAFGCICEPFELQSDAGAELMYLWYKTHRASSRREPVRLMIGNTAIEGFVISFTEDIVDAASSLVQWGVTLALLPEDPVVVVNFFPFSVLPVFIGGTPDDSEEPPDDSEEPPDGEDPDDDDDDDEDAPSCEVDSATLSDLVANVVNAIEDARVTGGEEQSDHVVNAQNNLNDLFDTCQTFYDAALALAQDHSSEAPTDLIEAGLVLQQTVIDLGLDPTVVSAVLLGNYWFALREIMTAYPGRISL